MSTTRSVARALGAFSLGLGIVQLLAPRRLLRAVGLRSSDPAPAVTRLIGARELLSAGGLLGARRPAAFTWLRVAGDAMDLGLVGSAMARRRRNPRRSVGTLAAIAAIAAVDAAVTVAMAQERTRDAEGTASRRPVRRAITIGRPRDELYAYWRDLSNLPRFMRHLQSVEPMGDGRSRWTATAPVVGEVTWEAEITEDRPGERIAWRSLPGSTVRNDGVVRFVDAPGDRGTEVHVELTYEPPAGPLGVVAAKLTNEAPDQQIGEDLVRLKQVLETGEVVVSEAVLDGRRARQRPAQPSPEPVAQEA